MNDKGILLVPGTDLGGSFAYHRELELFGKLGMSPAQVLRRATYDMAEYLNQDQELGSIEKGKYADFFLVPGDPTANLKEIKRIQMVVSNGTVYFPSDIYPFFGIEPFAEAPEILAE
jgi:imidazolonepropionase-like amidohydrolase